MRYPTINQYLESLSNPHLLFRTLGDFSVERDLYGEISFFSGNYAVIFKCIGEEGRPFALKCYTRVPVHVEMSYDYLRTVPPSPYLVPGRYLRDEILVYDEYDRSGHYSVTVSDWVEGETLGQTVERLCCLGDEKSRATLRDLAAAFDRLALWLLEQEFAHGDLKHDNIIVTARGDLRLIDYDGIYFPALKGRTCSLVGSPVFQHPQRDTCFFNSHIDDYPIALISANLHALAENPSLYARYNEADNLILNPQLILAGNTALLDRLEAQWMHKGDSALVRLCRMLCSPSPILPDLYGTMQSLCLKTAGSLPPGMKIADDSDSTLAVIRMNGYYGYADLEKSRIVIEPLFREAKPFSASLAAVLMQSGWRFIDTSGRVVIDCSAYETVEPFREGLALVCRKGLYGYIDTEGREAIPARYLFATGFRESLAVVRTERGYGYIDTTGFLRIDDGFDFASRFRNGSASVEKGGETFKIDKSGNLIGYNEEKVLYL